MHLLGWHFPGFGRYDHHEGKVPEEQRREDAKDLAHQHGAYISEWNFARQDVWPEALFDENFTPHNPEGEYGPTVVSDGSDGSDCEESSGEQDACTGADGTAPLGGTSARPSMAPLRA